MTFADQPAALVAACRRVLARQTCCGPLWWACARLLTAEDIWVTAHETISMLEDDPTESALSYALGEHQTGSDRDGSPVEVLRARALGDTMVLLAEPQGARTGVVPDGPRWLVAGMGTALCEPMWGALVQAAETIGASQGRPTLTELSSFTHVVGPFGPVPLPATGEPDCPVAPELFTLAG